MKIFFRNFFVILLTLAVLIAIAGFIGAGLYLAGVLGIGMPWWSFLGSMVLFSAIVAACSTIFSPKE